MAKQIDQLIINSPYEEPKEHWQIDRNTQAFNRVPGRRSAGYFVAGQGSNQYNDLGEFIQLPTVNEIRNRVKVWRDNKYPGITSITRKLLEHWYSKEVRRFPFFFCQLDAIETIIWLAEAPDTEKTGIDLKGDGGDFNRICTKLCTGGGKTIVMAMLIAWQVCNKKSDIPPVMISVANRTETAARIQYAFQHKHIITSELCEPEHIIHIDSKILEKVELEAIASSSAESLTAKETPPAEDETEGKRKLSKKEQSAILRETVNTVGQMGKLGEQIRNVISVGMLTEGWDAKTVTHILGLRAFSSQLLCEQVIGRGLRRSSYDIGENGLFAPEYVNIFGIPFTFLPHEGDGGSGPPPPPKYPIQVNPTNAQYEISWPNIIRIDHELDPHLHVDISKIEPLTLDASKTRLSAELAPFIDGHPDLTKCSLIDLEKLEKHLRMQEIIFKTSARLYEAMNSNWKDKGTPYALLGQVFRWVERYLESGKIIIEPALFIGDDSSIGDGQIKRKIMYMLNMNQIVQHLWKFITCEMTTSLVPFFNPSSKIRSTGDMPTWWTTKYREPLKKSHISHCVFDSTWEATEAYKLEKNPHVTAFAKNDHLGFGILYTYNGVPRYYYPDFLIRLDNGKTLVLETKGQYSPQVQEKRKALEEWIETVNSLKEYGQWCSVISFNVADVDGIVSECI